MTFVKASLFHKAGEGSGGGGGGGDQHNLGWYATQSALETAHPTANDGDWAIVGSTDTVWVWDSDTTAWKDTDQKGQVTSVNGQTGDVVIPDELPTQTGQSGKFLTTDGTDASWATINALQNTATGSNSLTVLGTPATGTSSINIGKSTLALGNFGIAIGYNAESNAAGNISIGQSAKSLSGTYGIAIGKSANVVGGCVQIAFNSANLPSNNVANTVKIANANGNFEIMSADGTIPADRLIHAINKYSTMPTASSSNEGWIVQFTGTTDSTYTHGHLYECVSDGQQPATYSWTEVSMGGGSSLPSQTGNAGKFLTTDGTDASWSDKPLVNASSRLNSLGILGDARSDSSTAIGISSIAGITNTYQAATAIGRNAKAYAQESIAIGNSSEVSSSANGAIQLGYGTNSAANTFQVKSYTLMSADGTIPHARLTNAVQSTTVTIATTDWSSNTASVTVSGLTATSVVWVAPDNASQSAYTTAGVYASSQSADTLTFTCTQTPSASLTINVVFC